MMTKVVGVRFKEQGKTYYFNPNGLDIKLEDKVGALQHLAKLFADYNCNISNIGVYDLEDDSKNVIFRTSSEDTAELENAIRVAGYEILDVRKH